jgi:hypothetical protein
MKTTFCLRAAFIVLTAVLTATLHAATPIWAGAAQTNANIPWSTAANWSPATAPTFGDDVKFYDTGGVSSASNINNTVSVNLTIGSLQYGNTNNNHTTLITNGVTLNVTNTGGLFVGTPGAGSPTTQQVNPTVTGGGTLQVSNIAANIVINQGDASGTGTQRSTLDLTGLNTFIGTVKNIFIGSQGAGTVPTANGVAPTGTLLLAKTNNITVVNSPANVYSTSCGIDIGYNGAGTQGGIDYLYLGQQTTLNVNTMTIGRCKAVGVMAFAAAFTNNSPSAVFRGTNGGSTRVAYWSVGDQGPRGSGSGLALGTNDFTYGSIDAMVDSLVLGQDPFDGGSVTYYAGATTGNWGVFAFNAGTLDVNTLTLGNIQSTQTNKNPSIGLMRINGNATLKVNTVLRMGYTFTNAGFGSAINTYGQLGITNGTALVSSITVASNTISANNRISLSNSTFIVSNALATVAFPLTNFYTANSTIGLKLSSDATAKMFVGTLTNAGTTNAIQLDTTPVFFAAYPTQFALIKFASWNLNNFGLTNLPGWAAGVTLVSNNVNKSVDVLLPTDPRPVITGQPSTYSGSSGGNVPLTVTNTGVAPLTYQWRRSGTNITDTGNYTGTTTSNMTINSSQVADSGDYTVIITNTYGSVTSAIATVTISGGDPIAPVITGPTPSTQTVVQGSDITFTTSVSGFPTPTIQWQKNGVDVAGSNATAFTVTSAQYPADQATYSIIASNSAGLTTNSVALTVYVTPVITTQPTNLTVVAGSSATFTVNATGVPTPKYQWRKNGTAIVNETNNTYLIASTVASDIATYSVVVSNNASAITSTNATLTVNSSMTTTTVSPTNGATGLCYDTPLAVTFSTTPLLRKAGTIKIFNSTNTVTPVDTIDLSLSKDNPNLGAGSVNNATNVQARFIQGIQYSNFPVIITGTTAAIYPHLGVMTSNQTYYVTIDNGCFTDTNGAYFAGLTDTNYWRFTTKLTGPANATNLIVAADGSGDFLTVQGAADSIPTNSTSYTVVNIRDGTYTEIVCVQNRNNITFRGQSRTGTKIAYANNNNMNGGYLSQQTCSTFRCNANDIAIENLMVTNTTPQNGSQAFALQVGNNSRRFVAVNADIDSYQDTILVANQPTGAFFRDCLIQGDVDYIWGSASMFFTNCEMRTLRTSGGYVTNPRAAATSNGIAFVKCSFTVPGSGYSNSVFARAIGVTNGNTAVINCRIDTSAYTGWFATDVTNANLALRWWEYGNSNLTATAAATFNGTQIGITNNDTRLLAVTNATTWLNGWTPALAPNIITQPVSQTNDVGASATFTTAATGVPDPTYQWQFNGSDITGATGTSLALTTLSNGNAGNYTVIVQNASGSVTSSVAALTVVCTTAAVSVNPANQSVSQGATATFSITATGSFRTYQWQLSTDNGATFNNVTDATNASYTTPATTLGDNGSQYRAVVSVSCDSSIATSTAATNTVTCYAAALTSNPSDQFLSSGASATFTVSATGSLLTYQWQLSTNNGATFNNITDATNTSYVIASVAGSDNGKKYLCTITAACGSPTNTTAAKLNVIAATTTSFRSATSGNWSANATWELSVDNGSTWVAATLTPTAANSTNITVRNSHTVSVTANVTADDLTIASGGIVQPSGATLTVSGTGADVYGTLQVPNIGGGAITGDSSSTLRFQNGGNYVWNSNAAPIVVNATWNDGSTATISNALSSGTSVATGINGQSFYDLTVQYPAIGRRTHLAISTATTVRRDLTIVIPNTASASVALCTNTGTVLTIGRDLNLTTGTGASSTKVLLNASGTTTSTLKIGRNFNASSAYVDGFGSSALTFEFNGTTQSADVPQGAFFITTSVVTWQVDTNSTLTLANGIPGGAAFTVNSGGTLVTGTNVVLGSTFTLADSATLNLASLGGIAASGSTGNIQTTTRNFSTNASYTYSGTAAQVLGSALPSTVANLTLASGMTNSVTVSNTVANATPNYAVSGTLTANNAVTAYTVAGSALKRGSYTLFNYGTLSGTLASAPTLVSGSVIAMPSVIGGNLVVPNTAPVGGADSVSRTKGASFKNLTLASLLANDTDVDGDTLNIASVDATSANGVALSTNATSLLYSGALTNNDSFHYVVADSFGGTASVLVSLTATNAVGQTTGSVALVAGQAVLTFYGVPSATYTLQVSSDLSIWSDLTSVTAAATGVINYTDTAPPTPNAYYRLKF